MSMRVFLFFFELRRKTKTSSCSRDDLKERQNIRFRTFSRLVYLQTVEIRSIEDEEQEIRTKYEEANIE